MGLWGEEDHGKNLQLSVPSTGLAASKLAGFSFLRIFMWARQRVDKGSLAAA